MNSYISYKDISNNHLVILHVVSEGLPYDLRREQVYQFFGSLILGLYLDDEAMRGLRF